MYEIPNAISVYIHWPFCKHKCPYCDFNSHVSDSIKYELWQKAYLKEIARFLPYLKGKKVKTIFFGGGTPSLMPVSLVQNIIASLKDSLEFSQDIEITLEANPTSAEAEKFLGYKEAGVNRLSLGVQSLKDDDLKFLGRTHSSIEAIGAIKMAKSIFDNFNFDLIYSRPNQTVESWAEELELAISLTAKHISLYQLTIEKGTPFYAAYNNKDFKLPNDKISTDLYLYTAEALAKHDIFQYEISNYAKPGYESKHNLAYWQYDSYLGIGPGAHSRITIDNQKQALIMQHNPDKWLQLVLGNDDPIQQTEILDEKTQLQEIILMGLRLNQGIEREKIENLLDKSLEQIIPQYLIEQGMVNLTANALSISDKGRLLTNSIIAKIIDKL